MADGYARLTSRPQCVIVHADVGTQGLGAAVHNASCGRAPVIIFANLAPVTLEGEILGSRSDYVHWLQNVPDQRQIVAQYCRYVAEIKRSVNIKQMVGRAFQFATSAPQGAAYLCASREVLAEKIEPCSLKLSMWQGIGAGPLPDDAVRMIADALWKASHPLLITGYSERNHKTVAEAIGIAELVHQLKVIDTGGSDVCFPADHSASLGLHYGEHPAIKDADVILIADCDVPWIPVRNAPKASCQIYHIDSDPLKEHMSLTYIPTDFCWRADTYSAFKQINEMLRKKMKGANTAELQRMRNKRTAAHEVRASRRAYDALPQASGAIHTSHLIAELRRALPEDTVFVVEAVTLSTYTASQIAPSSPGTWIGCGGSGRGWSGGAALGVKLASGPKRFVCQIVGDGSFMSSMPSSVYWISHRYDIPILTVVLNNKGWNAPKHSLLSMYPDGEASKATDRELGLSFDPQPDYGGIAKAAAGHNLFTKRVSNVEELPKTLRDCVESVEDGHSAVLDAVLDVPMKRKKPETMTTEDDRQVTRKSCRIS